MTSIRPVFLAALAVFALSRTAHAQWIAQTSGTTNELRGLSVVSPQVAWASGQRGTVIHTVDGGATWLRDTVAGATTLDLRAIAGISATTAHAISIGDSSRIYRTTDGGKTWSLRFAATRKGTFFDAIRFWDPQHGIAVSDPVDGHFVLVTTNDGGDTWAELPGQSIPPAIAGDGSFAASGSCLEVHGTNDVWFVTGGAAVARVFHSGDRGKTWTVSDSPIRAGIASAGIFSIAFRDATHGAIAGGDYTKPALGGRNMALTADGGRTWTVVDSTSAPPGFRSAVTYVPTTNGRSMVAVGLNGTDVSNDGGKTWSPVDATAYNSVQFASPTAGYTVGPRGRVAKWTGTFAPKP
ncbi:MAG: glycosyl hydrolase [bacterium]